MPEYEHFPNTKEHSVSRGLLDMLRSGVISQERSRSPEFAERPEVAWLFDVDGVLTDPELKTIKNREIIDEIILRLQKGEPIGGNTGRSMRFMESKFLDLLEERIEERGFNKTLLENVYIVSEKGGAWILYDKNGIRKKYVDKALANPEFKKMQIEARRIVEEKFSDIMFFDETKETMISIEMHDGKTIAEFQSRQAQLIPELKSILAQHKLGDIFRVDATRIATDIENTEFGKALGAMQFTELLLDKGIKPKKFIAFGDSGSDYEMAEELHRLKQPVEFVFVGGEEHRRRSVAEPFPITFTRGHCDDGTLEYLQKKK